MYILFYLYLSLDFFFFIPFLSLPLFSSLHLLLLVADWTEEIQAGCKMWVNHKTGEVSRIPPWIEQFEDDFFVEEDHSDEIDMDNPGIHCKTNVYLFTYTSHFVSFGLLQSLTTKVVERWPMMAQSL